MNQNLLKDCNLSTAEIVEGISGYDIKKCQATFQAIYTDRKIFLSLFDLFMNKVAVKIIGKIFSTKKANRYESEELYQETFLELRKKIILKKFNEGDWRGFTYTLANGVKWNWYRNILKYQVDDLDRHNSLSANSIDETNYSSQRLNKLKNMSHALGPVGVKGYEIIKTILTYELQSNAQVAEILDTKVETIRRRLSDYRQQMRQVNKVEIPDTRLLFKLFKNA